MATSEKAIRDWLEGREGEEESQGVPVSMVREWLEELGRLDGPRRVPITLTHVQYTEGDLFGMLLAWFSLLPIFILVAFVTLVLFKRDLHTICFFVGVVVNEGSNFALKHIIKEPRPNNDLYTHTLFVKHGMPSSHAQFMAFFATYFALFVYIRVILSTDIWDLVWKTVCSTAAIVAALAVCGSRFYLGYHSWSQILCGVLAGCVNGILWFLLVHLVLSPYFPQIFSWKISELVLLKDVSRIPNILWFEYTSVRQETRKRLRRKSQ